MSASNIGSDSFVILFRDSLAEADEVMMARHYFEVLRSRTLIEENKIVIPRYSALPFYKELEDDISNLNSKLINSYKQHRFVANLENWYEVLKDFTPKTWFNLSDVPHDGGPFVLKGETNSKKFLWDTHMFAKNRTDVTDVYCRLMDDGVVSDQKIVIREFVKLKKIAPSFRGLQISNEFRFFVLNGQILCGGFYWSNVWDDLEVKPSISEVPKDFLMTIVFAVKDYINFFVIDVAQTEDGNWIVIELNDGQQSGLSMCDSKDLYGNMYRVLNGNKSLFFSNEGNNIK
jgi:hypothetical protein